MTLAYDPAAAVAALARGDKQLAKLMRRVGPFAMTPHHLHSPFESLLQAITHQQLAGKAARTIHGRVVALFPNPKRPKPEALLAMKHETLRGAGLSTNKTLAVLDLAKKTLDGTVPT